MMSDEVARNTRLDPLFPTSIVHGRKSRSYGESRLVRAIRANKSPQAHFANMRPGGVDQDIGQAAPVELWDLAMGAQHNKSAGLAARIFVDVLLDIRLGDFETAATKGVLLPGEPIDEFLVRLYPIGHRSWRPSRQFQGLRAAISVLEDPETRIAWEDPKTNRRGERRVVVPVDFPLKWDSNAWVRFAVFLPPGSTDAFILDRIATRAAGAHSVTAWRLYLNLSAHWGQPGKLRMPVRGGRTWLQVNDPKRYPIIDDKQLVAMAFPGKKRGMWTPEQVAKRRHQASRALTWLEETQLVALQAESRGRRILPANGWAGWGANGTLGLTQKPPM